MTEVLHSPSSSSSSSSLSTLFESLNQESPESSQGFSRVTVCDETDSYMNDTENNNNSNSNQLSLLEFLLSLLKKSFGVSGNSGKVAEESLDQFSGMEIGWPTDVRHVAHVTFDRFNGFLGLPVEFEPEVLRRAPSASATVFGVSTESMQLSYDSRGNSIPVILILMQQRLYSQGGLQAEGIFRINADNSQEEQLRSQLNSGIVPDGIDVHCLAGLIKAWFRELPTGVLDPLAPEQVIQCQSEEDCFALCRQLPPTETALLDWAINLMADVVQYEHLNKMNSHNIAMVFAPNMTHMVDPLTALMYAVQVMNFLKSLITKTLREREDRVVESFSVPPREPSDENGDQGPTLNLIPQDNLTSSEESESEGPTFCEWPAQSPPVEPKTRPVSQTREPKPAQSSDPEKNQTLATNLSSINNQIKRRETWR